MVIVQNLSKRFGAVTAVDDISFQVESGQSVALWGENGAGKTTALRCLLGVIPYDGSVLLGGYDTDRQGKAARRLMGFVPQEISFHDDLTAWETLNFYYRLKKTSTGKEYVMGLLDRLGLAPYTGKRVRDLSGGMKQRLALVIALLADPPLLILDEPTANLDVKAREEFLALLVELKENGKTLVFSSHRLEEVAILADRVLVIEAGRLLADCPPAELGRYLGRKSMLKLLLADEASIGSAVETLAVHGYAAERNGTGVWVQVVPLEKARPISLLSEAGIPVEDFHIE
ncbi:MAG TPA: ABC transporter ATP-binding protein [Anaerolineae bacterium]|jgi:ABC-type multidrug transport system ATPase subunit|nr:ABC transporter ATP-binding protein [Anaerolineae bacterium]